MKTALVLEGGALRTIYSSGVCDAFLDGGLPLPDYTLGVSAGIAYGVSYLSRQSRRNLQLICHYANDKRYMGFRNLADPRNRSYFGLKFAYETIPNELIPFDYDAFAAYPGRAEAVEVSASAAVLMDMDSGRVLYERNAGARMLIASTTKILTALVAIRDGKLSDTVRVSREAAYTEGSSMYLKEGEELTLETLLYGLLLCSGNDAAVAVAEHVGGSVEGFVERMNEI